MDANTEYRDSMMPWIDKHGWLSYIPTNWDNPPEDGFGDSPHHSGFWAVGLHYIGCLDDETKQDIVRGFIALRNMDGSCYRTPVAKNKQQESELMNRDQWTGMLPALVICEANPHAIIKSYDWIKKNELIFPHQSHYFDRCVGRKRHYLFRLLGDFFELLDTVFDAVSSSSGRNSSIIKNLIRHTIAKQKYPTFL